MTLRNLFAIGVLFVSYSVGDADDSIKSVLKETKHVGTVMGEPFSAVTLHVYSPEEFAKRTASLAKYKEDQDAFAKKISDLDNEFQEAKSLGASTADLNELTHQRNLAQALT